MSFGVGPAIDRAFELYARGEALEAHEVLEDAWHEEGRTGALATLLKALIRLCAARVKQQQGNALGVASHTEGTLALLEGLANDLGARELMRVRFDDVAREVDAVRRSAPPTPLARVPPDDV